MQNDRPLCGGQPRLLLWRMVEPEPDAQEHETRSPGDDKAELPMVMKCQPRNQRRCDHRSDKISGGKHRPANSPFTPWNPIPQYPGGSRRIETFPQSQHNPQDQQRNPSCRQGVSNRGYRPHCQGDGKTCPHAKPVNNPSCEQISESGGNQETNDDVGILDCGETKN